MTGFTYSTTGVAIANITVGYMAASDTNTTSTSATATTTTDANGKWTFSNITKGDYDVRVGPVGSAYTWIKHARQTQQESLSLSRLYINEDSNASQTSGITINQLSNDDEILAFKSTDVTHGITSLSETDTFATFKKADSNAGGLITYTFSEDKRGYRVFSTVTTDDTTKTQSAEGNISFQAWKKSGIGTTSHGANANLLVVADGSTARFMLDVEGDSYQDVGTAWTNFDDENDIMVLDALSFEVSRPDDPIKQKFLEGLDYNRESLEAMEIVTFNDDGHHFINWSRYNMLMGGAVRQLGARVKELESELGKPSPIRRALQVGQRLAKWARR